MLKQLLLLLIASTIILVQPAKAAYIFPKKHHKHKAVPASQVIARQLGAGEAKVVSLAPLESAQSGFRKPFVNPDDKYSSTAEGMFSIVCAVFSIAAFVALSVTSSQFFIIPALVFAIGAFVFGALGLKRHKAGYAIVGMVLGLIEIVASFAVMADLPRL